MSEQRPRGSSSDDQTDRRQSSETKFAFRDTPDARSSSSPSTENSIDMLRLTNEINLIKSKSKISPTAKH